MKGNIMKVKTIFLACPIGQVGSDTYKHADTIQKHLIKYTIERYSEFEGIEVVRADQLAQPGKITTQIIRQLTDADICVADLTNLNPNVLYELGIRQAMLKPYILIAKAGTDLPFDLKDTRTIFYDTTDLDSMSKARDDFKKYLIEALKGNIDPYDEELFSSQRAMPRQRSQSELKELRLMETLDSVIEAEHATSHNVDALSQRLSSVIGQIETLFTTGYRGAGTYLYISGEQEAFSALVAALARAKKTVRTTRYSPFTVSDRQEEFAKMIRSRVLGDKLYSPVQNFYRIVAANNILKLEDVKEYIDDFIGKRFTLFLTPQSNNFELVIIDNAEVFIHFHGRDKIIDSTLHIISEEVARKFTEIYSSLNDPILHPDIKKYDFEYIAKKDSDRIFSEIKDYFNSYCQ